MNSVKYTLTNTGYIESGLPDMFGVEDVSCMLL